MSHGRGWWPKDERGISLVFVAAFVTAALALSAVAIDLGMLYSVRAELQRAADAAALAGAKQFERTFDSTLMVGPAHDTAVVYAFANQVQRQAVSGADTIRIISTAADRSVSVSLQRTGIRNWFAAAVGYQTTDIRVFAKARLAPGGKVQCVKPIAVPDLWSEPAPAQGGDSLGSSGVYGHNHIWDLPPPPPSGGNGNQTPTYNPVPNAHFMEEWRWTGAAGQSYVAPGSASSTGWGSTVRNGVAGYYADQPASNNDIGRRMVLMIMDANGVDIQPSSFFQAWLFPGQAGKNDLANDIRGSTCGFDGTKIGSTQGLYDQSNGLGTGQIGRAWDDLYSQDPNAVWNNAVTDGGANQITGSNKCPSTGSCSRDDWVNSPRVITVAMYNPVVYATSPSNNGMKFNNFARVFLEQPFKIGSGNNAKRWVMARFIGYAQGVGVGEGGATSSLVKSLQLVQ
jgi:hypothetical protein